MKIKIRKASIKDAIFFYELRNEKSARKNFFNKKNIKYNDHLKWYKNKLKKKNVIFLVALTNNSEKIGTVRYETEKIFTNISINISKKFRNLGYGSKIIKNSEKFLKQKIIIISRIKSNNKASIKIFKKNNYKVVKNNNDLMLMKFI
jgi:UDP-2,4-diacetamido-2,4,6-trideoxy-beta-L-altropyranose hydrolase